MQDKKWDIEQMRNDLNTLSFEAYLLKYYKSEDSTQKSIDWNLFWARWMSQYVDPAFDPSRRAEFVKNFGLVDEGKFDFTKMEAIHSEIQELCLFPPDIERFIGFMAGTGFFKSMALTEWLNAINWQRKYVVPDKGLNKTPLEIISLHNGDNFLRANLTLLDWWRR
ncbi:MAG TPA: hypothetical protein PLL53_05150 [Saprospiraceae bacterium]|nr:hypothetical protein [Saprospiraceae bacterium]